MICISIAHSSKFRGAANTLYNVNEYEISRQASRSCFEILADNGHACTLIDCGSLNDTEYSLYKTKLINSMNPQPDLAIEIHLNSSEDKNAHYGEVLYKETTKTHISKTAAESICQYLKDGFTKSIHPLTYKDNGAVADDRGLFFLDKVHCPSIIVEGLFVSNNGHADWLKNGGAQAYGSLVAHGLLHWIKKAD